MTKNKIAEGLKKGRQEKGYSVKEVSEFLVNKGFKAGEKTIYSWESGNSQPTPDVFLTLCIYYGIDDVLKNFGDDELNTNNALDDEFPSFYEQLNQNEEILFLYNQLDEGDKGEIRGEIKHMLKAKKYSSQNANMDMEIAEEIVPQIPIDINKMSVEELEEEYKKRKLKSALKRTMSNVLNTAADTQNTNIGGNASNQ